MLYGLIAKSALLTVVSGVGPTDLRWVDAAHSSNSQFVVAVPRISYCRKSRHGCKIKPANYYPADNELKQKKVHLNWQMLSLILFTVKVQVLAAVGRYPVG